MCYASECHENSSFYRSCYINVVLFQVLGLGPTFKIYITLQNMSTSSPVKDLSITFHCDDKLYIIERPFIQVSKEVCLLLQIVKKECKCI
jgi:hypothetical protein